MGELSSDMIVEQRILRETSDIYQIEVAKATKIFFIYKDEKKYGVGYLIFNHTNFGDISDSNVFKYDGYFDSVDKARAKLKSLIVLEKL